MKTGIEIITEARQHQIDVEGFYSSHDDTHTEGELANAAACYALTDEMREHFNDDFGQDQWLRLWPFELQWLKLTPDDRIKELGKAGGLIAAEIDRLNREKELI